MQYFSVARIFQSPKKKWKPDSSCPPHDESKLLTRNPCSKTVQMVWHLDGLHCPLQFPGPPVDDVWVNYNTRLVEAVFGISCDGNYHLLQSIGVPRFDYAHISRPAHFKVIRRSYATISQEWRGKRSVIMTVNCPCRQICVERFRQKSWPRHRRDRQMKNLLRGEAKPLSVAIYPSRWSGKEDSTEN